MPKPKLANWTTQVFFSLYLWHGIPMACVFDRSRFQRLPCFLGCCWLIFLVSLPSALVHIFFLSRRSFVHMVFRHTLPWIEGYSRFWKALYKDLGASQRHVASLNYAQWMMSSCPPPSWPVILLPASYSGLQSYTPVWVLSGSHLMKNYSASWHTCQCLCYTTSIWMHLCLFFIHGLLLLHRVVHFPSLLFLLF